MTTPSRPPRDIDGNGRTIHELLAGRKYSFDYYRREYKWQQERGAEPIDDLASRFLESHEKGNGRGAVAKYGHYFSASIIVTDMGGQKSIIHGQQRLATLTLLPTVHRGDRASVPRPRRVPEGRARCAVAFLPWTRRENL